MSLDRRATTLVLVVGVLSGVLAVQSCTTVATYPDERPLNVRLPDARTRIDLDSFRTQFAHAYVGPPHTHERRAICSSPQAGVGCIAKVTIQALGESKDIRPNYPFKEERVIGRIRNLDSTDVTEMYSLKPASEVEYLIVVDGGPDGVPRWNLLEVPAGRYGFVKKIPGKKITPCPPIPHVEPEYSDVDFANCGDPHPMSRAAQKAGMGWLGGMESLLLKFLGRYNPRILTAEPGEWMYCPSGCCT